MDTEKFGKFIADRRKELNMTQSDLAKKLNVTSKAVSRWERGVGLPDINTLSPLAESLNLTIIEVMNAKKDEKKNIDKQEVSSILDSSFPKLSNNEKEELKSIILFLNIYLAIILLELFIRSFHFSKENTVLTLDFPIELVPLSILLIVYGIVRGIRGKSYKQTIAIGIMIPLILVIVLLSAFLIIALVN